ncbi:hypothetical protein GCM10028857_06800 [Salinarchaeum chitinilyticum]
MTDIGYTLSSEKHSPTDLVEQAVRAEQAGFDFRSISDHYHPWVSAQGHSPFAWATLGGVAAATESIDAGYDRLRPADRRRPCGARRSLSGVVLPSFSYRRVAPT